MDTQYLDSLPAIKNKYKVELQPGEKVVFAAKPWGFTSESGTLLGYDTSTVTMTNQRIIADNGQGIWFTDIADDVVDMRKVETGRFLSKQTYILVTLNKEVTYGIGIQKLTGYRFHFHKKDMAIFEDIIRHCIFH